MHKPSGGEKNAPVVTIVEVKSHLQEEGLDQLRKTLRGFRELFPEHAGKKVYGILAAVYIPDNIAGAALQEGEEVLEDPPRTGRRTVAAFQNASTATGSLGS